LGKKRILCIGDSLTWGFNPVDASRFDDDIRWTGVLQKILGDEYKVIEEGQNGRTIYFDDTLSRDKSAAKYIWACLESQNPLDTVIIMLGTNDLKVHMGLTAAGIAKEMEKLLDIVCEFNTTYVANFKILLMAPPCVPDDMKNSEYGESFGYISARERSLQFPELYKAVADKYNIDFLDTNQYVKVGLVDSIHLEQDQQALLAQAVARKLR